jgi:hypothetical protein
MAPRPIIVLALLTLAAGPLLWLAFGRGSAAARPLPRPRPAAAHDGACDERTLAYGLTDDRGAGREYESRILFGAHPPLPRPGFYAPADTPDPDAVLHALSHHWLVVKYRPGADTAALETLARGLAARRVLVISGGDGMPFAVGALVWGAQLTCAHADLAAAGDFARRHAAAL